jgi:hypothetical protein
MRIHGRRDDFLWEWRVDWKIYGLRRESGRSPNHKYQKYQARKNVVHVFTPFVF